MPCYLQIMTSAKHSKRNFLSIEINRPGYASNVSQSDCRTASSQHTHKPLQLMQARILFSSDSENGGSEVSLG